MNAAAEGRKRLTFLFMPHTTLTPHPRSRAASAQSKLNMNVIDDYFTRCREEREVRKEAFRALHKKAATVNEDVMNRFYGITTNQNRPVRIDEATFDHVLNINGGNGMAYISANRSGMPQEVNDEQTKNLIRDLKRSGYSYLPIYGVCREANGEEDDYVPSFIVFNRDRTGNPLDFEKLCQFALSLCAKYNQGSVLIKEPDKSPVCVDKDGYEINSTESSKAWKNAPVQTYFMSFKSKKEVVIEACAKIWAKFGSKLTSEYEAYCSRSNLIGTEKGFEGFCKEHLQGIDLMQIIDSVDRRYTDGVGIGGCYVNPMPCQLTERMRRVGEVMLV